ncbi:MAG TPA: sialate O-acetylesterase [Pelobium sp.]|nr:sialate O-acetylesterase [Pelobium sp.]
MKRIILFIISVVGFYHAFADVKLPALVSDGMVLQRNTKIIIWGWADVGEKISITFKGKTYQTQTLATKKWSLSLPEIPAGGPFVMTVKGNNTITIKDILVGDVWLASGQSNMEFEMFKAQDLYADEISNAYNPNIRQFEVIKRFSFIAPLDDVKSEAGWQQVMPQNVLNFTAVGYFFAKNLYQKYKVPIGIINATWGGTPAEAWVSEEGLQSFDNYTTILNRLKNPETLETVKLNDKNAVEAWYQSIKDSDQGLFKNGNNWGNSNHFNEEWSTTKVPSFWRDSILKDVEAGVVWYQRKFTVPKDLAGKKAVLYLGNIYNQDSTWINGVHIGNTQDKHKPRVYNVKSGVLKSGENSITIRVLASASPPGFVKEKPYKLVIDDKEIDLQGVWKYHLGVAVKPMPSTTNLAYQPAVLYKGMIKPMLPVAFKGVIWYQGEANTGRAEEYSSLFPALITDWRKQFHQPSLPFLFVQLPNYLAVKPQPSQSNWSELREAQLKTLSLPNTGMAVTYDLGEWNDIHPHRKKEVGERLAFVAQKVAYGNKEVIYTGPTYQSMEIKGNKIIIHFKNTESSLVSKDGQPLKYFAIAGADRKFVWANAQIVGNTVEVWNDNITTPVAVRYAWADNPDGANLFNRAGLPASPFRTDNYKDKR